MSAVSPTLRETDAEQRRAVVCGRSLQVARVLRWNCLVFSRGEGQGTASRFPAVQCVGIIKYRTIHSKAFHKIVATVM